jgi:hypothetical protein
VYFTVGDQQKLVREKVLPTVNVVEVALLLTSHIRPTFRAQVAFAMDLALQKVDNIQVG